MRQLTLPAIKLPELAARLCPACGSRSRHLRRRGPVEVYTCSSCGLSFDVHDPNAVSPPRKRGAGPRQARPSVNRDRSLTTIRTAPDGGTVDAR
jgi:hypothetical protein